MPQHRILHLIETLEMGGAENLVIQLASYQKEIGHEVSIICLFREGELAQQARKSGINVYCCEKDSHSRTRTVRILREFIKKMRPNILHTHNAVAHYYGVFASLLVPVELKVNTRHGMAENLTGKRRELIYKVAMGFADYAVFVCDAARALFVEKRVVSARKAKTITNGIELGKYKERNSLSKDRVLKELSMGPDSLLIGVVGRLNKIKNHEMLIAAFADLIQQGHAEEGKRSRYRQMYLLIVGDGENRGNLEKQVIDLGIEEQVRFLGSRRDVPEILAGLDIFCLPSYSEGFSLALTEAAATGLPAVATDVGGNSEIVEHGVTGLLTPSNDVQAFRDGLAHLINDEDLRVRMGRRSLDWARERASLESMNRRYMALLGN
jgi:glycosyltransferase involved in cell wall biosynthesis